MYVNQKPPILGGFLDFGGDMGIRTPDLLHAKQPLSQLSYTPSFRYNYIIYLNMRLVKSLNRIYLKKRECQIDIPF